jgi:YgiT-type zinc finger domain-containing protein
VSKAKKCPKCGGEMVEGSVRTYAGAFHLKKAGDIHGDRIHSLYCKDCGFIEFYKKMKTKKE